MGMEYTKEQRQVIEARGATLLVSAAAGSGKTAVLTRRILELISDRDKPVDIDRLLVVTFTNAAAAQMRERIGRAIMDAVRNDPENMHLRRQQVLIHNARICTIDSFCSYILRSYFGNIGLDPGFRIGDQGEIKLIEKEAVQIVVENRLNLGDEEIVLCMESLSDAGDEESLMELIRALCRGADSHPFPVEWLDESLRDYENLSDSSYINYSLEDIRNSLEGCAKTYERAIKICELPDGPYMFAELLEGERLAILELLDSKSLEEFEEGIMAFSFGTLSRKKDSGVDPDKRKFITGERDGIKKVFNKIKERYFFFDKETRKADLKSSIPFIRGIVSLSKEFLEEVKKQKAEKNLIDFSDGEHLCLSVLLKKREDGLGYEPTDTAKDLRDHFAEIMVDEYQDSNMVQELLLYSICADETGRPNRFMVGDIKQSIYRFRQARPELFMEKLSTYSAAEGASERKIVLSKNFRSRYEVTDFVNLVFGKIMLPEIGGVVYDDEAKLYPGAEYPQGGEFEPEVLLISSADSGFDDKKEAEARVIALKIKDIIQNQKVTDEDTGLLRAARYSDIAILLRSPSGWGDILTDTLKASGIPAYSVSSTGYFQAPEVKVCLDVLRIIVNPLQDLPLFNVMQSPIGGFSEEEIAKIRLSLDRKEGCLYEALTEAAKANDKARDFLDFIGEYKRIAPVTPVRDLIRMILTKTDFWNISRAMARGGIRDANLKMLMVRAAAFEKNGVRGIFSFIRYMEQLEKYEVDFGEAGDMDENSNVVRIMSIHKSKGLEFPICIVAGIGGLFNLRDTSKRVLWDPDLGFGCDYVDPEKRVRRTTIRKSVISRKLHNDTLGEELRVLYVAFTRAREKLILTGTVTDPEAFIKEPGPAITYNTIAGARSCADLLKGCIPKEYIRIIGGDDIVSEEVKDDISFKTRKKFVDSLDTKRAKLPEALGFEYPGKNLSGLFTKTTVSELKAAHMTDELEGANSLFDISGDWGISKKDPYTPSFVKRDEKITGARRGSAYHRIMELIDMTKLDNIVIGEKPLDLLGQEIASYVERGLIEEEDAALVPGEKILAFGREEICKRMAKAQDGSGLYREQPFILGISAGELNRGFPPGETVLIQGIIDVWWEEEDGIVILDYKTDRISQEQKLVDRYELQLLYYEQALKQLTHKNVKEKLIYSFYLDKTIVLN